MRMCFDDDDRYLIAKFDLKEEDVFAEAWPRAMSWAYYVWWRDGKKESFDEGTLPAIFYKRYQELSNELGC